MQGMQTLSYKPGNCLLAEACRSFRYESGCVLLTILNSTEHYLKFFFMYVWILTLLCAGEGDLDAEGRAGRQSGGEAVGDDVVEVARHSLAS